MSNQRPRLITLGHIPFIDSLSNQIYCSKISTNWIIPCACFSIHCLLCKKIKRKSEKGFILGIAQNEVVKLFDAEEKLLGEMLALHARDRAEMKKMDLEKMMKPANTDIECVKFAPRGTSKREKGIKTKQMLLFHNIGLTDLDNKIEKMVEILQHGNELDVTVKMKRAPVDLEQEVKGMKLNQKHVKIPKCYIESKQ